jgi:hypothetical protein
MSATSEIAGHMCLEAAAIDTLEFLTMFKGIPTFGSTQTIFAVIQTDAYYLEQNKYKAWPRHCPRSRDTRHDANAVGAALGRISALRVV